MNSPTDVSAEDIEPVYQCRLPLSRHTIAYLAGLVTAHRKKIGSRWRSQSGRIAVLVLAVLCHDQRAADLAGANDIAPTTMRRWVNEAIELLTVHAPRLDRALKKIKKNGDRVVLLDGTLVPTRRRTGAANRRNYSGKRNRHGLLFLALTDTRGNLIWISAARRGTASEITTARGDHICAQLRAAGLGALADLGFVGLDDQPDTDPVIITGRKATRTRKLTTAEKQANQLLSVERAPVEHGFSDLKNWRILTRPRMNPAHATQLLRALLVLSRVAQGSFTPGLPRNGA